ncbi:MAG TPA: D-2-hydroxyacid dehydrogenase [Bacilli bacterium]|nr:D-2-hydroxyacid dehydrogenase [Bacilli bacterium]
MILVTTCPVSDRHLARIREIAPDLDIRVHTSIAEAQDDLPHAELLLTYGEDLTQDVMDRCKNLKWIPVISAGLELMPFAAIAARDILVTNARGIHKGPMAEHTMGLLLLFARRFLPMYRNQLQANWDRSVRLDELDGQTLGVIGAGSIGTEIAKRAKAFGMRTLGVARSKRPSEPFDEMFDVSGLDELLQRSDFVVVITPQTPETEGLIGERELGLMKRSAVLINIARGVVVDEAALLKALQDGTIAGAALDVFTEEPLPSDHPFWQLENCFLTPHISSRSPKYMERAQEIFRHNLRVYVTGQGEMINVIDPQKGY